MTVNSQNHSVRSSIWWVKQWEKRWGRVAIALMVQMSVWQLGAIAATPNPPPATAAPTTQRLSQATLDLQLNDSGEAISALQTRLTELGYYNGPISGVFGSLTEAAVIQFQSANGLTADGIVGAGTREALERAQRPIANTPATNTPTATPNDGLLQAGDFGAAVSELQQRLRTLGYYQGGIDGEFGPQTTLAVEAFQRSQNLPIDGIVGTATAAALQNPAQSPVATNPTPTNPAPTQPNAGGFPAPTNPEWDTNPNWASNPAPAPVTPGPIATEPRSPAPAGKFTVLDLQWALRQRGFYRGEIDGILGSQTRQAIYDAQRAYGLSESDFVGGQ